MAVTIIRWPSGAPHIHTDPASGVSLCRDVEVPRPTPHSIKANLITALDLTQY